MRQSIICYNNCYEHITPRQPTALRVGVLLGEALAVDKTLPISA